MTEHWHHLHQNNPYIPKPANDNDWIPISLTVIISWLAVVIVGAVFSFWLGMSGYEIARLWWESL